MKYYYLTGFVVGRMSLGEADRIITLFTKEIGKTKVVAKGIRKSNARLSGYLEPFNEINIRLTKAKSLDIIIGAQAKAIFDVSKQKENGLVTSYYMNELIARLLAEDQANIKVYNLYKECLQGVIDNINPRLIRHYFALRFLQALGLEPDLTSANSSSNNYFVYENTSIVNTRPNKHYGILSITTIKLWRLILNNNLDSIKNIQNIMPALQEGERLVNNYYEYHFDLLPKSLKVFQDSA